MRTREIEVNMTSASVHIFIKDDAKLRTRRICLWASYKVGEEPTQEGTVCFALLPASSFCCVVKRRCNRLLKEVRQSEVRSGLSVLSFEVGEFVFDLRAIRAYFIQFGLKMRR